MHPSAGFRQVCCPACAPRGCAESCRLCCLPPRSSQRAAAPAASQARLKVEPARRLSDCLLHGFLGFLCLGPPQGVKLARQLPPPPPIGFQHYCRASFLKKIKHTAKKNSNSWRIIQLEIKIANRSYSQKLFSACQWPSLTSRIWDVRSGSLWLHLCFPGFKSEP